MKKTNLLYAMLGFILLLQSCSKDPFTLEYKVKEFSRCLPANQFWGPAQYDTINVSTADIQNLAKQKSKTINDIKSVKLAKVTVQVSSTGLTFDEISNVSLYIREASNVAPNASNKGTQVAYSESIAPAATSIDLAINGTEVSDLIKNTQNVQFVLEILNKDKTLSGGTPPICLKVAESVLSVQISQ
jgi:urease gamma subunit